MSRLGPILWRFCYTAKSGSTSVIIHKLNEILQDNERIENKLDQLMERGPKPADKMTLQFGQPTDSKKEK